MKISEKTWMGFVARLRRIDDRAAKEMMEFLHMNRDPDGEWTTPATRKKVIDHAFRLTTKYGEASSEWTCQMYDMIARVSEAAVPPAEPAMPALYKEVARAVNGAMEISKRVDVIGAAVSRLVKRTGADTMLQNALRDKAEWAWIPNGDTCAFCITLASRGWQKASKDAMKNGHAEHIHANCDCTYAVRFSRNTEVAGYDPDKYLAMYENADGDTPKERIDALRREFYAENKEKINAQKRDAYAKRKELESSRAEETDVGG